MSSIFADYYYQTDHLGTPQQLIDRAGSVVHQREMRAFGEMGQSGIRDRLSYPGQLRSDEAGANYNYFRFYDSGTGLYMQIDPISILGGLNLFLYANASPVRWSDVLGLLPECGYEVVRVWYEEEQILVEPELSHEITICWPHYEFEFISLEPDMPSRRRQSLTPGLGLTGRKKCRDVWLKVRDAMYRNEITVMMDACMVCEFDCGRIERSCGLTPKPIDEWPNIEY